MSERSDAPVISLAGVAVAREVVSDARRRLIRSFRGKPEKWKAGGLAGLKHITRLIVSSEFPVVVSHIHKGDPALWARFFDQGRAFMAEAERKFGDRLPYLEVESRWLHEWVSRVDRDAWAAMDRCAGTTASATPALEGGR